MGKTKIGWTHFPGLEGASWNPFRAIYEGRSGWMCIKHGAGCRFCYAELLNLGRMGNGLPYTLDAARKVKLHMSTEGQTSIDWPVRSHVSHGIFPCSMTDWIADIYPVEWSNLMLAVMGLAQHHIFLPLTKRWERMFSMLEHFTKEGVGITVPDGKVWDLALLKARGNQSKWEGGKAYLSIRNNNYEAVVPWPFPNVLFGVTIVNDEEAFRAQVTLLRIKQLLPSIRLWISYEPALEEIDWYKHGFEGLTNWLVVGGESGENARPMDLLCILNTIEFGKKFGIPVYVKQMGTQLAQSMGLSGKGEDVPANLAIRQFPDISRSYISWK